jgi:hypothetical protein
VTHSTPERWRSREKAGLNMGGRIYDQSVGRFLQPDPFVQAPFDTQGLNHKLARDQY